MNEEFTEQEMLEQTEVHPVEEEPDYVPAYKERHGFVTFWLLLGLIAGFVSIFLNIHSISSMSEMGSWERYLISSMGVDISSFMERISTHILIFQIGIVLLCICSIISFILLLRWKKLGFWIRLCVPFALFGFNYIMLKVIEQDYISVGLSLLIDWEMFYASSFGGLLGVILLWAILQIKKNGISCWKLLE